MVIFFENKGKFHGISTRKLKFKMIFIKKFILYKTIIINWMKKILKDLHYTDKYIKLMTK